MEPVKPDHNNINCDHNKQLPVNSPNVTKVLQHTFFKVIVLVSSVLK
jgi:hypothetical protein